MILTLKGVLMDGSEPAGTIPAEVATQQSITWPEGEDGTIRLEVVKQDKTAADLTGAAIVLGVRHRPWDAEPALSREATITDAAEGLAEFPIVSADTLPLELEAYHYDVQLTDAEGKRWQLVPASDFEVVEIAARPDDLVTVPEAQEPLAQGPPGPAELEVLAEDPASPSDGAIWVFDSSGTRELRVRIDGVTYKATLTAV